jgi:hypothetical protein
MRRQLLLIWCLGFFPFLLCAQAQSNPSLEKKDSSTPTLSDTVPAKPKHDPRKATRRSAIIPGWGQAYNKEYWKIPLVYGVLAIPTATFIYNNDYYKKTRFAYDARIKAQSGDSSDIPFIDPELKNLSAASLQNYRNTFRRNRDMSILFFILAWGLQVVDATVFAHLKDFDVSKNLSLRIQPDYQPGYRFPGLGIQLHGREPAKKPLALAR